MRNLVLQEVLLVVFLLVQPDNSLHIEALEDLDVLVRVVAIALRSIPLLNGTHEGHELSRDDPVDVSVLYALKELVFLHVERLEVIPLKLNSILEALQALEQGAVIEAVALRGVTIGLEQRLVGAEHVVCLLSGALKDYYHKGTHQESAVHHLVRLVRGAVVKDAVLRVVLVFQQSGQFPREPMHHRQI